MKYTSEGKIEITCKGVKDEEPQDETSREEDKNAVKMQIIISDTGCGIPQDKLQAMFMTFEQADSEDVQSSNGLGLGLAVVARIVEQVGGTLRAESEVNVGSKFFFTITMLRHDGTVFTDSTDKSLSDKLIRQRSRNSGRGSEGSLTSSLSEGTRELDSFVDAFSTSHMAGAESPSDSNSIKAAEARMNEPGTFPVQDSSWPIRPARPTTADAQINNFEGSSSSFGSNSSNPRRRSSSHQSKEPQMTASPRPQTPDQDEHIQDMPQMGKTDRPLRILVVEDDDVNRKILDRRLSLGGHSVLINVNGQEALDRIKEDQRFDCILMDIQ